MLVHGSVSPSHSLWSSPIPPTSTHSFNLEQLTSEAREAVERLRIRLGSDVAQLLTKFEVEVLRDKLSRSVKWAADPQRAQIGDEMTNDEAAAIMLYTQGW